MDTIQKLSTYAKTVNSDISFMGVPKTIDNDLAMTDHTPGFGSAAKYIGAILKEVIRDNLAYDKENVTIIEIMGRNAGWLTGASALSRSEDCQGPDLIYMPELDFNVEAFLAKIEGLKRYKKNLTVVVSEGIKLADGRFVCELTDDFRTVDMFGHKSLSGTARFLANQVGRELNIKTRAIEFSTLQRCAAHLSSRTDITEAFQAGGQAVKAAFEGHTGKMIAFKRTSDEPYHCTTEPVDVNLVANIEKKVPREWITEDGTFVTKEFLTYTRPLIQAELTPIMVDGLPRHLYFDRNAITL